MITISLTSANDDPCFCQMETDPRAAAESASVPEEDVDEEEEEEIRPPKPNIPAEVLDGLSPAPTKDEGDDVAVVLGSEDWHRAVPSVRHTVIMFIYLLHFFTLAKGFVKLKKFKNPT